MPIYEYRCKRGHDFEEFQRMADDPLTACGICGAPAQRVFSPIAVHFKGSGFYTTDYGKKKAPADTTSSDTGSKTESKPESKDSKSSSQSSSKKD